MDKKKRITSWLKEPIFSKKVDPFLIFLFAFAGAMSGTTVYPMTDMPFWQFCLLIIPFAFLTVFLLKMAGTVWKSKRKQHDAKIGI